MKTYNMNLQTSPNIKTVLLALFVFIFSNSFAQENKSELVWPVKLEKSFEKTVTLKTEQVVLSNRFGKMKINTWDKKEVKVEVSFSVGSRDKASAAELLDRMRIDEWVSADKIGFKTSFKDPENGNDNWNNNGYEMHIDYTVYLPNGTNLIAENNFGEMNIGNFEGNSEFTNKYGSFIGGKLGTGVKVKVEFGKANIESMENVEFIAKYSKAEITQVSGKIKVQFDFCNSIDLPVSNLVQQLDVRSNYTSLYLVTEKGMNADYDIIANNSRASGKADIKLVEVNKNNNINAFSSTKKYQGSLGKGGNTKINIQANFGSLRII
jgi:hypothetical protein